MPNPPVIDKTTPVEDPLKTHKIAAGWMYRRRAGVGWWTPDVLTLNNPSVETLCIEKDKAKEIFAMFETKGFIRNIGLLISNGEPAYAIVESKIEGFKQFSDLPWYIKRIPEWVFRWVHRFRGWLSIAFILIVTSFFQSFFGKLGEKLFERLTK